MSSIDYALRETQTYFLCIDLNKDDFQLSTDEGQNLLKVNVQDAEKDGTLQQIASTYDLADQVLRDGIWGTGRKVISFAHILQNETFPLAKILQKVLFLGQKEMGRPVEIEFAVELNPDENGKKNFYLLQIRPMVDSNEMLDEDIEAIPKERTILRTNKALGQGVEKDVYDLIYIKPETFQASKNQLTAYEIDKINRQLNKEGRGYVLIGPGRWGSSDTWLGIPVKWPNIASVRLIVEADLSGYRIDPSQGTHFFQNLTSFGVSYYNISNKSDNDFIDYEYLESQPAVYENEYFRHLRFDKPIVIKTDGKKSFGVLLKP
jgi:phosphopantetheine adenylyltransferase